MSSGDSIELPRLRVAEPTADLSSNSSDGKQQRAPIVGRWGRSGSFPSISWKKKTTPAMPGTPRAKGGSDANGGGSPTHDEKGELIVGDIGNDDSNAAPKNLWLPMISPQSPRAALWMVFTMILLIYIAIMLPYRLGFGDEVRSDPRPRPSPPYSLENSAHSNGEDRYAFLSASMYICSCPAALLPLR
jgi:hypothetical protein